ncbi:cell division protein FtsQ/DivIB [Streptomyces sp. WAC06614]|uniref:cell division protein FtsQ/DivIB n=1 Tax=Streptomyces sp. WAC06614 TaxID=2487416 RepID=UPI000F7AA42D|nr:FtsQ-type POTRA domain-containing protein [Streptomyces sp. WAC06614]RSS82500.1 FtsQ-type POTRA domain-containing protein [Streptomyces sp. WAC06614]
MAGAKSTAKSSSRSGPQGPGGKLRRGPVLASLAAAVLLVGGATWALYGSGWLRVEKVTTSGTEVLTPAQVLAAAEVPVGEPLVSVDTEAVAARLRGRLPRIDSVDVVRAWPHGIGLKVTERKPVLLIRKDANFIEVDASGVRFDTVGKAPAGVPVLELTAQHSPSARRFDEERLLHEAVGIAGDLPAAVARQTLRVKVSSYDAVVLELAGGRNVVWGSSEHGPAKGRALTALLKAAPKADHFDVSAPSAPAVSGS